MLVPIRFYPQDISALANAGATYVMAEAQDMEATYTAQCAAANEIAEGIKERIATLKRGRAEIMDRRSEVRAKFDKETRAAYYKSLAEPDTTDHAALARDFSQGMQELSYFTSALQHHDQTIMPGLLLQSHRAEAEMFLQAGNLKMTEAVIAAIERHEAAKGLVAVDGVVTISASGRAHTLWQSGLEIHRRAAEASAAADKEQARQNRIAEAS